MFLKTKGYNVTDSPNKVKTKTSQVQCDQPTIKLLANKNLNSSQEVTRIQSLYNVLTFYMK